MEVEEEVAQITGTLTRANDSRSRTVWVKLIKEEDLDFSVDLQIPNATHTLYIVHNIQGIEITVIGSISWPDIHVRCSRIIYGSWAPDSASNSSHVLRNLRDVASRTKRIYP